MRQKNKHKPILDQRQRDVAWIIWEAIRRNSRYKQYFKTPALLPAFTEMHSPSLSIRNIFESHPLEIEFGISSLIPPEKNFASPLSVTKAGNKKDYDGWGINFGSYLFPVYMEPVKKDLVACAINLRAPRAIIESQFKTCLTVMLRENKKFGKKRLNLELTPEKAVDKKYYQKIFLVFDFAEEKKQKNMQTGRKRIDWKDAPNCRSEKEARDAYKKARELVEGGFRRIS